MSHKKYSVAQDATKEGGADDKSNVVPAAARPVAHPDKRAAGMAPPTPKS